MCWNESIASWSPLRTISVLIWQRKCGRHSWRCTGTHYRRETQILPRRAVASGDRSGLVWIGKNIDTTFIVLSLQYTVISCLQNVVLMNDTILNKCHIVFPDKTHSVESDTAKCSRWIVIQSPFCEALGGSCGMPREKMQNAIVQTDHHWMLVATH